MTVKIEPTEDDLRAGCARLGFPPDGWDIIKDAAVRVAAERMLAENRAARQRLLTDKRDLARSERAEDLRLCQAHSDELERLWKVADELSRLAFPDTYRRRAS